MTMKHNNILYALMFLVLLISCTDRHMDKELFNGEIRVLNDKDVICKEMNVKPVALDGVYSGMIAVYDSILICRDDKYPDFLYYLFNIDSGKEIGAFCRKGNGPDEFSFGSPVHQFHRKDGDLMTILQVNQQRLAYWNLTKSLTKGEAVYDTIVPCMLGLFFFQMPDSSIFNVESAQYMNMQEAFPPYCELIRLSGNRDNQKIPVYKTDLVRGENENYPAGTLLSFWSAIKPDGSKLVQVMNYLPQLNIIDTHSGEVVAYRKKGGPGYSILQSEKKMVDRYYLCVQADDKYIYAPYWGKEQWDGHGSLPEFNEIHVFDWDGNLCYKLTTDRSFFNVSLDPVRNRLYTRDWNADDIYYLDLNELND